MPVKKSKQENNNIKGDNIKELSISKQEIGKITADQLNENTEAPGEKPANMEAYHPHRIHPGRNIKDYFFEFIMLFIAITAGFFMENLRESVADRHKEKEYIMSLVKDIANDTANIQGNIQNNQWQSKGIDSLLSLLAHPGTTLNINKLYDYTFKYLNNYNGFTPRDITMTQLKNTGGLRLIEKKPVLDSIVIYYATIEHYRELNEKTNKQLLDDLIKLEVEFLDFNAYENQKWDIYDATKLKEFHNRAIVFNSCIKWDNQWLKIVDKQANSLLKYLKKEYKI